MNILLLAIGAALVNNVILSQFLGLCPFLGVSKSVNTAIAKANAHTDHSYIVYRAAYYVRIRIFWS